ncbi:YjfB family protein [Crassaminicella profunda]|nr:YjfB family protein [Crassaminicella profunda]
MDVAAMSTMMSQSKVQQQASLSVMKMVMDTAKGNGQAMTEMMNTSAKTMELSVNPHVGGNLDLKL